MIIRKKQSRGRQGKGRGDFLSTEKGAVIKKWGGKTPVCVVFPNSYYVGMSNLAVHILYERLNSMEDVVCERAFLPEDGRTVSLESARPLSDFEIVFFTLSFELDYINIPRILKNSSIGLTARDRGDKGPIIVGGGICVMSNPEPISDFFDLFIAGDVEATIDEFMETCRQSRQTGRRKTIEKLSAFDWVYNPAGLEVAYNDDGTVAAFKPDDFAVKICRHKGRRLGASAIIAENTEFSGMFLAEGSRGCPSRCPFCLLGNLYDYTFEKVRPDVTDLADVGILGGGVSFHPQLVEMAQELKTAGKKLHLPSMRIDEVPIELIELMKEGVKTLTFGIEAASERLRRSIGKTFTDEEIFEKLESILEIKPFNLKLYFMIGLYGETDDDLDAIGEMTKKIKHIMVKKGAKQGFVGSVTVHVSPFVPKPFTPFQWLPMEEMESLKGKISRLARTLGKVENTYFTHESVKFSFLQACFARGDRRLSSVILRLSEGANLSQVFRESPLNLNFYALRLRGEKEIFPWDFIKGNMEKEKLYRRLERSLRAL